jgi:HSP20 family protein
MAQPEIFFLPTLRLHATHRWQPAVDVYRHGAGWLVKCDLAGVRPQDVCITAGGRRLTIAGARRDCSLVESAEVYSMEITYDRFERTIELPCEVEKAEVHTDYQDGMLLIRLTWKGCADE